MRIEIHSIRKKFGAFTALNDVSLNVEKGELVAILGPSGSGKTSLLRIIAGLESPDAGTVTFDGEVSPARNIKGQQVGFVFQHYALFRHMTVFENIAFGLRVRPRRIRRSNAAIHEKVTELLRLIQLEQLADRYPSQLSGGQRQRVALARALAIEPKVLLLDEPFGALDAKVRRELRRWLRQLHNQLHITSIFVTHDQEEALELADRLVVMRDGNVEQIGTVEEVYNHPANPFVYDFLGNVNLFHARVHNGRAYLGNMAIDLPAEQEHAETAKVYVRPHLLEIEHEPVADAGFLRARVTHITPAGPRVKVELSTLDGELLQVDVSEERFQSLHLEKDAEVYLVPKEMKIFAES